jgi:hypothetical protein
MTPKCKCCGKFMRKVKPPTDALIDFAESGEWRCVDVWYNMADGHWEHD